MASNNKKKKKEFSFEEWSNANHGISKEQEEEDARKRQAYLAQQSADIAPVKNSGANLADSALSDPHFQTYSNLGAAVKNPSFEDATKGIGIAGWRPFADEIQNPLTFAMDNEKELFMASANGGSPKRIHNDLDFMYEGITDEEVGIYNYYLAKYGKEKATEYLESIQKDISKRMGEDISKNTDSKVAEILLGGLAGVESGVKGATVGMKNLITGSEETMTPSPVQYADQILAEDNDEKFGLIHDTVYGIGNMTPSIMVGVAAGPIAGATAMGMGVAGNKYNAMIEEGYDTAEAQATGVLNGVSEGLTQYLIGGIGKYGGKAASSIFSKVAPKAAGKITEIVSKVATKSPRILQAIGHASVEMGKESTEEALQTYLEPLIDSWVTGEEFEAPEFEEVVYNALLGAITSGVLEGAPAVGKATVDTIKGKPNLTADEQAVVDKVVEEEIAAREAAGEKPTAKEKELIKENVQRDLENGYISTDKIEEILGGDSYKAYKDTVTREDALRKEYEDLGGLEKPTLAQQTRYGELHAQKDTFVNDDMRNDLRSKAKDEVRKRVSGSRLEQSYLEIERKNEKFTADPAEYKDENARKTVENIVNSGLLDNTNKSHEMVDNLAKLSKDRKVTVELTNNKKLKAEGKVYTFKKDITADGNSAVFSVGVHNIDKDFKPVVTVDGKAVTDFKVDYAKGEITFSSPVAADSVIHVEYQKVSAMNASYTKGKRVVTLNVDAEDAWQTSVGHEITHSIEEDGTDAYSEYVQAIREYAEKVGTYESVYEAVSGVYNDGTDIESEVTAILTGEYLFTDEGFVEHLHTNHRNIFQKIYDAIKHWINMVSAGSKEARALERAKHTFEKAYSAKANVDTDANQMQAKVDGLANTISDLEAKRENVYRQFTEANKANDTEAVRRLSAELDEIDRKISKAEADLEIEQKNTAESGGVNFSIIGETKDGRRCYESGFSDDVSMDKRIELFKERIATIFNLGAVELKTDVKKIQVRGDRFTFQKNLFGDNMGQDSEKEARINALYDLADILATSKYDPSETNQEESYKNPSVKPKNPAHKGVKYWYKFRNEIVFDGVPYTVTFNIRDKGAEQYQYLIDFKENKTPNLSNTAVKSLLRADRVSHANSIALTPENVNTQTSISSESNGNQSTEEVKVLEGGTAVKYSLSTWTPETKDKVRKNLVKAGYEAERVDKWIDDLNGVASVIASDKDRLGFEAADNQVMLKNNQEYVKTLDASTLCAKRLQYQGTFNAIQHRLPNTVLTSDDLIELQNMLKEHGYEAPCSVCYVESRRRHLGKFAQEWLDGYNGEYKPHLDEVTTSDGLETLRHSHPQTYKDFVDAMNAKGSANPKVVQLRTEYRNDIMSLTKKQVDKIEAIGGLRIQSFSDFETPHLLDMMQAVMDMSAKGLTSQAYTKVPNFAWVFGDTGIKINLSLIAEGDGFDSEGNLAFSSVEGMDINDAMAVRNAYSENVGTIIVGANDKHILACMADDRIDYIIPFHRSGWGKNEMDMMGLGSYDDYSYGQNEHDLATGKKVSNLYPPDYWDYNVSGKENAERYLKLCAQTGREPKFSHFLVNNGDGSYSLQPDGSTDGYWKTLIDFKMYDNEGNGAKQQKVQPNFNMEEAYRVLDEYEGGANSLPVANDVVDEFVAKHSERNSLSDEGYPVKGGGTWRTPIRDLRFEAPVREDIAPTPNTPTAQADTPTVQADTPTVQDENVTDYPLPDEPIEEAKPVAEDLPMPESDEDIIKTVKERLNAKITNSATELEETKLLRDWVKASYDNKIEKLQTTLDSKKNKDTKVAIALRKRIANLKRVSADIDADIQKRISDIESRISKATERLQDPPKKDLLEVRYERIDKQLEEDKIALKEDFDKRKAALWESTQDKAGYISNKALDLYNEVKSMRKGVRVSGDLGYLLDNLDLSEEHKAESYKRLRQALIDIKNRPNNTVNQYSEIESIAREMLNASYEDAVYDLDDMDNQYQEDVKRLEADAEAQKKAIREQAEALHRADVQRQKIAEVESHLNSKGFSLDEMLDNPVRQLSTFETVDTMPQRVMEKTFGYEAGQALADATVNKVAQNESAGLKWLDSITNRKNGLLAQLSKQYNIKPHSKEIAAAMMYGEGSWVNEETGEEFAYGDAELAKDFPDVKVQNNIKALVRDPRIRQFYDETLDAINESRKRNGYPEIPRRANYFLHYRELGDFFTKNGLPFNPNDARAKDLPTDMVGRTADLKPGQPFFTSSWQRKGKKTSYDLFEGMERYANSAKNQIYHIDDIQTLRALHYHLAERFGQAQGLENLNKLTPEQASEQIKKVYGSHLSTFAAFLDTEANILAGKTSMIDRALSEGMLGRRILTFMDALNQQTGATMVGYNVSSANTNWLPVVREFANSNPVDSVKALAQTVANIASRGKLDSFREDSTVYIRRQGADRFNRKLWQKMQDPAYALMGAVDSISTEIIARTEYNKAIREGMNPQQAHYESDKKVSRLMADRSLGQMPQMYTSRVMGLITKFQLEVRNDMDSMFYDTIQEEKLSRKDIENARERNAKTAAKVAWRYCATAIALHAFGQAFEAVAGYNPAFDIIEAITKAFGWDDDEDDEDTWRDNLGEGAMSLLEDLPYAGIVLDGGRIPISSAIPDLKGMIEGKDEYGNDKSVVDHIKEIAPYMLPAGGNQLKKTVQGLKMFSDDHPVTGSYTDSGSLRFPVEATPLNVAQAAIFGQYASKNAREYFDNDYAPLKEKQIQEYIDVDMPIKDYWEYREGLNDIAPLPGKSSVTLEQKLDYVDGLDLPTRKKNILANNISSRKDPIDMTSYGDYDSLEEFDFATDKPEKYAFAKSVGGYSAYKTYSDALYDIKADKDENGKSINGSRKEKVLDYINNLDADYYTKILLWKSEYPSDDSYDYEIIEYLNNRSDMSYTDRVNALTELGFRVTADGQIYVD